MYKFFIEEFVEVVVDVLLTEKSLKKVLIYSNEDDCLYICKNGENYDIEYKSSNEEQFANISVLKYFALYKEVEYSINEQELYKSTFLLKCNSDIKQLIELLLEIEFDIFGNKVEKTEFYLSVKK